MEAVIRGRVTPDLIGESVPWSRISKALVVFEDEQGSLCILMSEKAKEGHFLPLAELQVANAALFMQLDKKNQ